MPNVVFNESISAWLGGPVHINTLYNWLIVEVPGNIGFPLIISAAKHPNPQISIPFEYPLEPNRIYGARYHLVAIYSVNISNLSYLLLLLSSIERTNPKSHNLASHA